MRTARRAWVLVLGIGLAAPAVRAESSAMEEAKRHYLDGKTAFDNKDYTVAIREFQAGYDVTEPKRIEFLLNIGTAYKLRDEAGDLERARATYQEYVDKAPDSDPQRAKTFEVLVSIDKEMRDREAARPKPQVVESPVVAPAAIDLTAAPAPPVERKRSKLWLIVIPIAAVVIAAVAVGIYLGTRSGQVDCGSVALGCIDASR